MTHYGYLRTPDLKKNAHTYRQNIIPRNIAYGKLKQKRNISMAHVKYNII